MREGVCPRRGPVHLFSRHEQEGRNAMRKYLALLVVAGLSLLPVVPAAAATSHAQARSTITPSASAAAAAWLAAQVKPDGFLALPATPTTANLGLTAQGLLSLAAAGLAKPQVDAMETYLSAHVDDYVVLGGADQPGPLAYLILDALATGNDATNFGGADLVTRLEATQQPSGLFGSQDATYDGAFRQGLSLLALHGVGVDNPSGATWLSDQQCADGGWTAFRADTSVPCPAADPVTFAGPDTNSSALAAEALNALGVTPAHDPVAWFTSVRSTGGGFAYLGDPTQAADANSTGLVTQALLALNGSPDTAGIAALEAFQAGCTAAVADRGGLAFQPPSTGDLVPDEVATVQGLWGLSGQVFPLIEPTIAATTPAVCEATSTSTTTTTTTPVSAATSTTVAVVPVAEGSGPAAGTAGELPRTGASTEPLLVVGFLLTAAGSGLVIGARRRRSARS
jgi:LPXTG-motif cell wall-anchored protein